MTYVATRGQFLRNVSSGYVLLAAEIAVAFFLTPFIIGHLGTAAYGIWSLMLGVIGYMGLIDIGIRGSVGRYINHYLALKDDKALDEVVGTAVVVLTGLSALAAAAAVLLGQHFELVFPKTPPHLAGEIAISLPLLAFGLWLSFVSSIASNLLIAKEAMHLTNGFGLLVLLLRSAAIVIALRAGHGILALVLVNLATSVLGLVLTLGAARSAYGGRLPRWWGFSGARLREIWRFGVASFTSRTAATLANDSAPIIGMWTLGPEAVGIYSVALTLTQNARRIGDLAGSAIFPSVMKAGALRDFATLRSLYVRFIDVSMAIGSLVFIGMMVFAGPFLHLWVGPQYAQAAQVVAILSFGYLLQGIASTASLTLISLDRVGVTVKLSLAEALACVLLTMALPGLLGLGLVGMALGTTLPRTVTSVIVYPWLGLKAMGPELRPAMWRASLRGVALCVGIAALFMAVHWALPTDTWPQLVLAVGLITALHLLLMASRLESVPLIGGLSQRLWRALQRLRRN